MKKSLNLLVLVLALFAFASFTPPTINNHKTVRLKKFVFPTFGGFPFGGVNYDATVDADTGVVTDLTSQGTDAVTTFSGHLTNGGARIDITFSTTGGGPFHYVGGFFTAAP